MAQRSGWTVLYDGSCALCRGSVEGIRRMDRRRRCRFVDSSDGAAARTEARDLDHRALAEALHVVDGSGTVHQGFFAVRELARLHPLGRVLRPLLFLPGVPWLGRRAYAFLARRRHLLVRG